jgi:hypothetical protein
VVRAWRLDQESGSERESGLARAWPMLALSAVAVRRGAWGAAEPAPSSVALVPARFLFPAPAAGSRAQPGPLAQRAAARPLEEPVAWDVPEAAARQPALAGTVLLRAAEHEVSVLPRAVEHEASAPQAAEHGGRLGEVAAAVAPVAVGVEAEQRVAAERAAEEEAEEVVRRREAPGAPAALPSVAPWAVAWAFHRDQLPRGPAPRPTARSARAMEQRPIGWP